MTAPELWRDNLYRLSNVRDACPSRSFYKFSNLFATGFPIWEELLLEYALLHC